MWDRLLRNARVVDPVNGRDGVMDVAVKDGRIAAVGPNLQGEASEVEDLTGLVVIPASSIPICISAACSALLTARAWRLPPA